MTKVAYRLRWFLVLLGVILLAFASSFFILTSNTSSEIKSFKAMVVIAYMLGLGEFDEDLTNFEEHARVALLMQGFFLMATGVILIVMMNLLIAEVGAAY